MVNSFCVSCQVLQQINQNVPTNEPVVPDEPPVYEEEFFVYKRRILGSILGDGMYEEYYCICVYLK